jgi:hypothetical protein
VKLNLFQSYVVFCVKGWFLGGPSLNQKKSRQRANSLVKARALPPKSITLVQYKVLAKKSTQLTTKAKITTKSKSTQITTQQEHFQPKSQIRSSPVAEHFRWCERETSDGGRETVSGKGGRWP